MMPEVKRSAAEVPVRRVIAFEDRAEIHRQCTLTLPQGATRIHLTGLPALVVDRHLSARFEGAAGAHLEDIHVERRWVEAPAQVPEPDPEAAEPAPDEPDPLEDLASQLKTLDTQRRRARQRYARALSQRRTIEELLSRYSHQVGRALWTDEGDTEAWGASLDALSHSLSEADAALQEARAAQWKAEEDIERIRDLVDNRREARFQLVADVSLQVSSEGGEATLHLSAVVPCAAWRPTHEAHLVGGDVDPVASSAPEATIRWTTGATIWQCTGEDWTDVELVFSTARPGVGARLPDLRPDRLSIRTKTPEEKKRIVVAHREKAVERDSASVAAPGVDDGGETRELSPEGRVTVPGDGRPHRISVSHFDRSAELALVARPEVARHVFLRARLKGPDGNPLLAGPVTLLRNGAYVGVGEIGLIGAHEPFEISFGSDDRFVVHHDRRRHVEGRVLGRDRTHFVQHVELLKTGAGRARILLELRLPVSEVEQVVVQPSDAWCSEGRPSPDADGMVHLPIDLQPGHPRAVKLGFWFETSGSVVLPDPW